MGPLCASEKDAPSGHTQPHSPVGGEVHWREVKEIGIIKGSPLGLGWEAEQGLHLSSHGLPQGTTEGHVGALCPISRPLLPGKESARQGGYLEW